MNDKPRVRYQGISVPLELVNEIKEYIAKNRKYNSIADFTKEAVRDKLNNKIGSGIRDIKFYYCPFCGEKIR